MLVMHDASGLGDLVRRRARDLAAAGYVALATDMYGGGRRFGEPLEAGELPGVRHDPLLDRLSWA